MSLLLHAACQEGWVPEALGVLEAEGWAQGTCCVVEREAVVDNVIRPHAKSIVHKGSYSVIPGKPRVEGSVGPWKGRRVDSQAPSPPALPTGICPLPAMYYNGGFGQTRGARCVDVEELI